MSLIDRYILKIFLLFFAAGVVVFVTLYLTADVMSFALRNADAGTGSLIKYYAFHTPWVIYQLVPVSCLLATLFTLSTMNRSHELTALFSLGMGLRRVALPILAAVVAISVITFFLGDQALPWLLQKRHYVEYVEIKKRPALYSTVKTNKIWYRTENILFNIKTLNPQTSTAQDITLYYFGPNWELTQLINAAEVAMKGSVWELKNGLVTLFVAESSFPLTKSFQEKAITMTGEMADIQSTSNSSDVMTVKELSRFIDRNKEAGLDTLRYEVDYHSKFGFALAGLVMSMLGIPFSVGSTRGGGAFKSVGICLALAFAYWIAYSSAITLGQHGVVRPVIAAWGPNALAMLSSAFLFSRLKR